MSLYDPLQSFPCAYPFLHSQLTKARKNSEFQGSGTEIRSCRALSSDTEPHGGNHAQPRATKVLYFVELTASALYGVAEILPLTVWDSLECLP